MQAPRFETLCAQIHCNKHAATRHGTVIGCRENKK